MPWASEIRPSGSGMHDPLRPPFRRSTLCVHDRKMDLSTNAHGRKAYTSMHSRCCSWIPSLACGWEWASASKRYAHRFVTPLPRHTVKTADSDCRDPFGRTFAFSEDFDSNGRRVPRCECLFLPVGTLFLGSPFPSVFRPLSPPNGHDGKRLPLTTSWNPTFRFPRSSRTSRGTVIRMTTYQATDLSLRFTRSRRNAFRFHQIDLRCREGRDVRPRARPPWGRAPRRGDRDARGRTSRRGRGGDRTSLRRVDVASAHRNGRFLPRPAMSRGFPASEAQGRWFSVDRGSFPSFLSLWGGKLGPETKGGLMGGRDRTKGRRHPFLLGRTRTRKGGGAHDGIARESFRKRGDGRESPHPPLPAWRGDFARFVPRRHRPLSSSFVDTLSFRFVVRHACDPRKGATNERCRSLSFQRETTTKQLVFVPRQPWTPRSCR